MSAYIDMTAAQLADCLDLAATMAPNTADLSMLDEATLASTRIRRARWATAGSSQTAGCGRFLP